MERALRLDGANGFAAFQLGETYYYLGRHAEAVTSLERALALTPGGHAMLMAHLFLAAAYAKLGRHEDAESERAVVEQVWPLVDSRVVAVQIGTGMMQEHLLDGLKKAGFR